MPSSSLKPEQRARAQIDKALEAAGWSVQDHKAMTLRAARGVAVREFPMAPGHGTADYLLFVDRRAVGVLEAKREETTLSGVEGQARKYSDGLPSKLDAPIRPLPFVYLSTGIKTSFFNRLDPLPRSREVFAPHRPETLAEWLEADPLPPLDTAADGPPRPSTLRGRLRQLPPLPTREVMELWPNQLQAIAGLEGSLAKDQPRALIQMATGSGKSKMAVAAAYRLIKHAQARRILVLVDRDRHHRRATWSEKHPEGRFRAYTYEEIVARDKASLDIFWLRDESLEDSASLPEPHVLAQEIADDLRASLEQIEDVLADLQARVRS